MIVVESRVSRRLVGRLDRGVDLFGALLGVCREHGVSTGEVRAIGSLEAAELAEFDQANKTWKPARKLEGGFEVVNLTGNLSERDGQPALHCHVTLMKDGGDGIRVFAGHVVSARVFALEFVLDAFDDVILRRAADAATGLSQWRDGQNVVPAGGGAERPAARPSRPVPVAPPTAPTLVPAIPSSKQPAWAEVAAASARAAAEEEEDEPLADDEDPVRVGDIIDHPKFGRSEVQRVEGADEFIHIRVASGRLIRLSLDVLKLSVKSRDGKKRVFKARIE